MQREEGDDARLLCTESMTVGLALSPTQGATYKFFAVAVLFVL
jgi:hypothetical protein